MKQFFLCFCLAIAGSLFLGSCNRNKPKGVLSKNKMARVLVDYHIAYNMGQSLPSDKRYQIPLLINGVLHKHHITQAEFDSSLVWYTRNPRDLNIIYTRVNRLLSEKEAALAQEAAEEPESETPQPEEQPQEKPRGFGSGDSVNVWQQEESYLMNRLASTRRMEFVVSPDTTFRSTDRIEWQFDTRFLPADGEGGKAIAFLLARYRPDSIMVYSQILRKNGRQALVLQNDSARSLLQLWGFIQYYPGNGAANAAHQLLIDHIRLMRYRKK